MKTVLSAAAFVLLTTAAHADTTCAVIRSSDGWLAVRLGPGTQHQITRKLLRSRTVYIENRSAGNWQFINTWVTKNGTTGIWALS